jgi:hypothetical protein
MNKRRKFKYVFVVFAGLAAVYSSASGFIGEINSYSELHTRAILYGLAAIIETAAFCTLLYLYQKADRNHV